MSLYLVFLADKCACLNACFGVAIRTPDYLVTRMVDTQDMHEEEDEDLQIKNCREILFACLRGLDYFSAAYFFFVT